MKIKEKIIAEIKKVYDPEIPVNIYDLGLIYNIEVKNENEAYIEMTLTSPNCPVADSLPKMVKENISSIEDIKKAKEFSNKNIEGIIVGKAIYDGDIKLEDLAKEIDA